MNKKYIKKLTFKKEVLLKKKSAKNINKNFKDLNLMINLILYNNKNKKNKKKK